MGDTLYRTTSFWFPREPDAYEVARGDVGFQPGPSVHDHRTLDAAEAQGQKWGCMQGVRRVEVHRIDVDGTRVLEAVWDKESTEVVRTVHKLDDGGPDVVDVSYISNRWQRVGEESKALGRSIVDEIARKDPRLRSVTEPRTG